jgi:hypothetical protein
MGGEIEGAARGAGGDWGGERAARSGAALEKKRAAHGGWIRDVRQRMMSSGGWGLWWVMTWMAEKPENGTENKVSYDDVIPFLPDHWYPHPRYSIPARIWKKKSTHHMPKPCTRTHLNLEGISMWWWAMTKVLDQPRRIHSSGFPILHTYMWFIWSYS